ncbi:MAG: hypothetical protein LUD82_07545 [Clostridiales bacterium]|nr:hypothetical protein [Clostridiales bacterium]
MKQLSSFEYMVLHPGGKILNRVLKNCKAFVNRGETDEDCSFDMMRHKGLVRLCRSPHQTGFCVHTIPLRMATMFTNHLQTCYKLFNTSGRLCGTIIRAAGTYHKALFSLFSLSFLLGYPAPVFRGGIIFCLKSGAAGGMYLIPPDFTLDFCNGTF